MQEQFQGCSMQSKEEANSKESKMQNLEVVSKILGKKSLTDVTTDKTATIWQAVANETRLKKKQRVDEGEECVFLLTCCGTE